MTKRVLSETKASGELGMSPQRSYARGLRRS